MDGQVAILLILQYRWLQMILTAREEINIIVALESYVDLMGSVITTGIVRCDGSENRYLLSR
jgi:hypothetical protein